SELQKLSVILMTVTSSCASDPCRSRRKEGEVALLESPNGLGATAQYQYAGECRTKSFAVFCRRSTSLENDRAHGDVAAQRQGACRRSRGQQLQLSLERGTLLSGERDLGRTPAASP